MRTSTTPPPRTPKMAKEGKISDAYSSAARTSVPPPAAKSGRRPTLLGRLFMRASVLLVSTSPLSLLGEGFLPRLGEEVPPREEEPGDTDERQDEEPPEIRREYEQAKPEAGQHPQRPPCPPLAAPEGYEDDDEGQYLEAHPTDAPRPHHGVAGRIERVGEPAEGRQGRRDGREEAQCHVCDQDHPGVLLVYPLASCDGRLCLFHESSSCGL